MKETPAPKSGFQKPGLHKVGLQKAGSPKTNLHKMGRQKPGFRSKLIKNVLRKNRRALTHMRNPALLWYVIRVETGKEFLAQKFLTQRVLRQRLLRQRFLEQHIQEGQSQGQKSQEEHTQGEHIQEDQYQGQHIQGQRLLGQRFLEQPYPAPAIGAAYVPVEWRWRRLNRYRREKTRKAYAALPGYLFIGFQRGQEPWFTLFQSLPCLYGVLGIQGRPLALTGSILSDFIHRNRRRFDTTDTDNSPRPPPDLSIGDQVHIIRGPFEGHRVTITHITAENACILMNLLGRPQDVEIRLDQLKKVA